LGLVLLVVATFVIASTLKLADSRSEIAAWTDQEAELVEEDVTEAIDGVLSDLESIAAFIEGGNPTPSSFLRFVQQIDGTAHAVGVGYTPVVAAGNIDAFISQRRLLNAEYEIFGLTPDGKPEPIDRTGRTAYYPIEFFAVGELISPLAPEEDFAFGRGMDAGYNSSWRAEAARAANADGPALSRFISINSDVVSLDRVFLASVPVRGDDGSTIGLVQALMLEQLLLPEVQGHALDGVEWEVIPDVASPTRLDPELAKVYPLEVPGGGTWSLAIAPTDETLAELRGLPWWVTGFIAATVAFFAALALWLFVDRRAEYRRVALFEQQAKDKDRFLASVSHELRTPLTVVSGLISELHDDPGGFSEDERAGLMDMLVEQTDELSGIVEDLLVAARDDIGMVTIHHSNVALGEEAARTMKASGIEATTRGIPGHAFADPQRVRQILRNLLTNAKRYGGPKVRIDFAEGVGWTEVGVADNGAGVPHDKQEAIFQSYESAHALTSEVRSVGLGLYISRTLARAMGGELEYLYDGTWSHFRLRLPSAPARTSPDEAHSETDDTPNPVAIV
jgi:signal transduction histidine kinase